MRFILALALLVTPALLHARAPREMIEIKEGEPVSVRPDRAYILFRTQRIEGQTPIEPIFMRIPTAAEMERYNNARREAFLRAEPDLIRRRANQVRRRSEAIAEGRPFTGQVPPQPSVENFNFPYDEIHNVQNIDDSRALIRGRPERVFLVEVSPGDYVIYGASYPSGPPLLYLCLCLGTVGFSAQPGVVTDLGYFLADSVQHVLRGSSLPELGTDTSLGQGLGALIVLLAVTMRPVQSGAAVPEVLRGTNIRPADYRAVGAFVDPRALTINRMAPIPNVLTYDGARVIDVRSGQEAQSEQ